MTPAPPIQSDGDADPRFPDRDVVDARRERFDEDAAADGEQQGRLRQRPEVLELAVTVRMTRVRRGSGGADREGVERADDDVAGRIGRGGQERRRAGQEPSAGLQDRQRQRGARGHDGGFFPMGATWFRHGGILSSASSGASGGRGSGAGFQDRPQ